MGKTKPARSLMVAFVADPYHALLWKRTHDKVFKDEIDQLLVNVNGLIPEVVDFIADLYKEHKVIAVKDTCSQGRAFNMLYPFVKGDTLITMCSDNYVLKKGIVNQYAEKVESGEYDAVGSTGLHCRFVVNGDPSRAIADRLRTVRLNPFMSFWNKKKLDTIDNLSFDAVYWENNYELKELGLRTDFGGHFDIMSLMSIKYLTRYPNYMAIPPENLPNYHHAGGLSSGVIHHFIKSDGKSFYGKEDKKAKISPEILAWHKFAYETTKDKCPLKKFNQEYGKALDDRILFSGYSSQEIDLRVNNIKLLFP